MEQKDTIFQPLRDKTILIVGEFEKRKQYILDVARSNGIKIIYIDSCKEAYGSDSVNRFIHLDLTDPTKDEVNADAIIELLKSEGITLDGCMTFGDDFTILTALISTKLELNGISVEGARIAYSKHEIHTYLNQFPETRDFATHTHRIKSENDVSFAFQTISLPGILKTEFGSGAYCVTKVHNKDDCLNIFKNFQQINNSSIRNEYTAEYALRYGVSLVLMDYIRGTEHDINVIIYNGQLIGAFVNDNGPTRKGSFFETTSSLPTCLTKVKTDKLIKAAYLCCIQLGLSNGVFNVEMKMTVTGPKLLEINSRIPGFYSRNWILELYDIDLANCAFQISVGIKPDIPGTLIPKGHIMGVMCVISIHNKTLQQPHIKKRLVKLRQHKEIGYIEMIKEEEWDSINPDLDWVCCNIAVKERNLETAKRKLLNICDDLDISKPEYPVEHYLKDFQNTTEI